MGNVKYFVAVLLCLVKVQGDNVAWNSTATVHFRSGKGVLASVLESPFFFHKCSATFLTPSVLLSTASCLKCLGDCDLFVTIYDQVDNKPPFKTYQVVSVVLHPGFEMDRENNDVGLIKLEASVQNSQVFQLPDSEWQPVDVDATIFKWQFSSPLTDFMVQTLEVKVISNQMCSLYLNQFISYQKICIHSYLPPLLGAFDYGTPIIAHYNGKNMILGMFVETGDILNATVVTYLSIIPHVAWINSVLFYEEV